MKQFLVTVAGVLVGLMLFVAIAPFALLAVVSSAARPTPPPARTVLVLDLREGLSDQDPHTPFAALGGAGLSVMGVQDTLRRAERDDRVKGLLVRLPEGGLAPAAADELRLAFQRFRAKGKPILAHSQGFYPSGVVTSTYELAAASGDIWMQPASSFQVTGVASEDMFFKRFFDRYGVQADFQQRYEYKNAVNPYLYSDYTPAHRAAELSWMGSVYETAVANAAQDRGKPSAAMRAVLEAGPYSAEEARSRGLIDHLGQVSEAEAAMLGRAGDGAKLLDLREYRSRSRVTPGAIRLGSPVIAVISGEGPIVTGTGERANPFTGAQAIYSDEVAKAFRKAMEDKDDKAIVFRVSSPGGADTASEQILSAVRAAKAAGKPVVVSMGTYAASGGYWISSEASEIVAEPSTLTGSIGVFGGKFALGPALARFGIDARGVKVGGEYTGAFGLHESMTPAQHAAFGAWMDRIYDGFIARVAEGRRIPPDRVREIAKGRVWTGVQAKALGLVDHLGGFEQAVARAKALGHVEGAARLKSFGAPSSPFQALQRLFGAGSEAASVLSAAVYLARDPSAQALVGELHDARLREDGATVLAPRLLP